MQRHYRAPWSHKLKIMTAGIVVFLIIVGWAAGPVTRMFLGVTVLGCFAFSVRGFSLHGGMLKVHHWGWSKDYDLSKLKSVEYEPGAMMGSIRIFGVEGLFGFIGYFRNSILGSYHAYATNKKHAVVLNFDGTEVVITPEKPSEFVKMVENLTNLEETI